MRRHRGWGGALRRWLLQTKQSHNGNRTRGGAIANQRGRHAEAGADAETLRAHRRSETFIRRTNNRICMQKSFERRTSVWGNLPQDCQFNLGNSEIRFWSRINKNPTFHKKSSTHPLTELQNFYSAHPHSGNQFGFLVKE